MSCIPVEHSELSELLGVVLCGGLSSRMGTHKALITHHGSTWAELVERNLLSCGVPATVFSVNDELHPLMQSDIEASFLIKDSVDVKGPLRGVLSVFDKFPEYDLLVMPCDMPFLEATVINYLLTEYVNAVGMHDFIVFKNEEGFVEPMPGIYSRQGLEKVFSLLAMGELNNFSLKHVLETGNTLFISLPQGTQIQNLNAPEDLPA